MSKGKIQEMDGVSLSNARQAQRLKGSMERDKEMNTAQDEEIARQKPASSTSSTGKNKEKD